MSTKIITSEFPDCQKKGFSYAFHEDVSGEVDEVVEAIRRQADVPPEATWKVESDLFYGVASVHFVWYEVTLR